MAEITVRNIDDELLRVLEARAAERGRSVEAEVRSILRKVLRPRSSQETFVEHLLAIPVDSMDEDPASRIEGSARDVEL